MAFSPHLNHHGNMKTLTRPSEPLLAGFSHRHEVSREEPLCHLDIELNVVQVGEAIYHVDGQPSLALRAGDILLIPGGTVHAIEVQPPFHMAVIHVHPSVFETLGDLSNPLREAAQSLRSQTPLLPCHRVTAPEIHERLVWLTEDAVLEQNRRDPGSQALLRLLAGQAAVHALRLLLMDPSEPESDETVRRIRSVQSWIDRRFMEPCSIDWLAGMANLAPTYFAARFRAVVGVPPMTYVRQLRLRQASDLLERTNEPVKVIAWDVGYTDLTHFHHAFKKAKGMTPAEYRRCRSK